MKHRFRSKEKSGSSSIDEVRSKLDHLNHQLEKDLKYAKKGKLRSKLPDFMRIEHEDSTKPKLLSLVANYRAIQILFIEWTRAYANISSDYPEIVTVNRAIKYIKQELINTSRKKKQYARYNITKVVISALINLRALQQSALGVYPELNDPDEPRDCSWSTQFAHTLQKLFCVQARITTGKTRKALKDVFSTADLTRLSKYVLSKHNYSIQLLISLSHSSMLDTEQLGSLTLQNVIYKDISNTEDNIIPTLYFTTGDEAHEKVFSGSLRNKNPFLCSHLSLALCLFKMLHIDSQPEDWTNPESWSHIPILNAQDNILSKYQEVIRSSFAQQGLFTQITSSTFKDSARKYCLNNGASRKLLRKFNNWDENKTKNAFISLPMEPMRALAGFDQYERIRIERVNYKVPSEISNNIFPFINKVLDAITNGTFLDLFPPDQDEVNRSNDLGSTLESLPNLIPGVDNNKKEPEVSKTQSISFGSSDNDDDEVLFDVMTTGQRSYSDAISVRAQSTPSIIQVDEFDVPPSSASSSTIEDRQSVVPDSTNQIEYFPQLNPLYEEKLNRIRRVAETLDYLRTVLVQDLYLVGGFVESVASNSIFLSKDYQNFAKSQKDWLTAPGQRDINSLLNPHHVQKRELGADRYSSSDGRPEILDQQLNTSERQSQMENKLQDISKTIQAVSSKVKSIAVYNHTLPTQVSLDRKLLKLETQLQSKIQELSELVKKTSSDNSSYLMALYNRSKPYTQIDLDDDIETINDS